MLCEICGKRPATDTHHLINGSSLRRLADQDHLTLEICQECHRRIHGSGSVEKMSKMIGQLMWEIDQLGSESEKEVVRSKFIKRYGKNWV